MTLTLRQIERYLVLASEVKGLEALDDSLLALYPHLTPEGRRDVTTLWKEQARMTDAPGSAASQNSTGPSVPWSQIRAFIGAPPKY